MKTISDNCTNFAMFVAIFITALFISTKTQANVAHSQHSLMGSHGMALMHHPKEGLFVSHLPLYKAPHNYQLIYKVQLTELEKVLGLLNKGMVTLVPERFDLTRLISGENFSVKTDIFQGHFERGGVVKFTTDITFVKPILIAKVAESFTQDSAVVYQVPLNKQTIIFAHKIQSPPSFDAIGFSNNVNQLEHAEMKKCNKPTKLNKQVIHEMLVSCELFDVKYVETQDFK